MQPTILDIFIVIVIYQLNKVPYLFKILPKGVVSKNDIGACNIALSKCEWKYLEAFTHPTAAAMRTTHMTKPKT